MCGTLKRANLLSHFLLVGELLEQYQLVLNMYRLHIMILPNFKNKLVQLMMEQIVVFKTAISGCNIFTKSISGDATELSTAGRQHIKTTKHLTRKAIVGSRW